MGYIVEVKSISKSYGPIVAIDDISFGVKEGEFFALLGPSGCGKTTILRILGGFIDQDSGSVEIDGRDMGGIPPNQRDTSMVFQNLALFPHMNVRDNIIYGLRKRRQGESVIKDKLSRIINIVGLEGFEKRTVPELSGGQKQRVALARSLILEPRILLLDEPLASLDKKLRIIMQDELKQIQKKVGTTFLYVTHDQGEALTMSDTIAVMNQGNIVQNGSPDKIYNCPENRFTADFIGAGNFIDLASVNLDKDTYRLTTGTGRDFILKKASDQKSCDNGYSKKFASCTESGSNTCGSQPVFFIRPEKIKISGEAHREVNGFKGIIKSVVFEGPDIRLEVDSPDTGKIRIEIKNDGTAFDYAAGKNIDFYWDRDMGILLES
ncbi:MAG: ABC transporter ATP-binding protein [Actinobacteria bacterium]|nr:ABC transporter ATP-binding protein [Actinomycetota bacterium]